MTSGFWIFDETVRNIYLIWCRHFDITSNFLFNFLSIFPTSHSNKENISLIKGCSGERIGAWIDTTLASCKFFLLLFIWINQRWKHNLDNTVITAFLEELSEFGGLELKFLLRSSFGYMAQTYGERQLIMKHQTWNVTLPNAVQISNDKQEANNKEFKAKSS